MSHHVVNESSFVHIAQTLFMRRLAFYSGIHSLVVERTNLQLCELKGVGRGPAVRPIDAPIGHRAVVQSVWIGMMTDGVAG